MMKEQLKQIVNNIFDIIDLLEQPVKMTTKHMLLYKMEEKLSQLSQLMREDEAGDAMAVAAQGDKRVFSRSELSKYDGKNGNPAYVCVNGIVYDVTNNSAWAAATHFGLKAGTDLSAVFASCHVGQDILSRLKAVGRLQDERLL